MKKRFGFTVLTIVVACLAIMPAAVAAPGDVIKATGLGDSRGLDIDVLGLVRLTLAAADGKFELSTQGAGTATVSGRAVGICNLITGGSDPLACSAGNAASTLATSVAPNINLGPNVQGPICAIPPINVAIVSVEAACGRVEAKVNAATPFGDFNASVAGLKVGLTADLKKLLTSTVDTVQTVPGTVTDTAAATVSPIAAPLADILKTAGAATGPVTGPGGVVDQVQTQLNAVLDKVGNLLSLKVLPAEVHVDGPAGAKSATVTSVANTVSISLLDGLIQGEVLPAKAQATYNGDSGKANCHAEAAVLRLKVQNILAPGAPLIDLAPGQNILSLLPLSNDLLGVKLASATPDSIGDTCRAEARGLELNVLKAVNGGVALRVSAVNAEITGAVQPLTLAAGPVCPDPKGCLPLTGGPTYLYMTAGLFMATAALGAFWVYRRLSVTV